MFFDSIFISALVFVLAAPVSARSFKVLCAIRGKRHLSLETEWWVPLTFTLTVSVVGDITSKGLKVFYSSSVRGTRLIRDDSVSHPGQSVNKDVLSWVEWQGLSDISVNGSFVACLAVVVFCVHLLEQLLSWYRNRLQKFCECDKTIMSFSIELQGLQCLAQMADKIVPGRMMSCLGIDVPARSGCSSVAAETDQGV